MINAVDMMYGQLISMNGLDALVDGKSARVLISETSKDEIATEQPLHEGSLVQIKGDNYLIISMSEQFNQGIYKSGVFEKTLPILLGSALKPVQAVVKKYRGEYVDGQYLNEVHDQYIFKISKNDTDMNTLSIGNDLIIYDKGQYNILSVDNTHDGILIITGKFDTVYVPHTYTISLNSSTQIIVQGETFQLVATATDNSQTVDNPTIEWTSNNEAIATVSNGLITGIGVGNCIISADFKGVSAIVNLTVNEKPVIPVVSYSYTLSNGTSLKYMVATTITATKTINGVADTTFTGANISYTLDSTGQTLLSQSKIAVTVGTTAPTFNLRNKQSTSTYTIHVTIKDSATGVVIVDNLALTLIP